MSEALGVLGQVCLPLTRSLNANHGIVCKHPASAAACQAQSVEGKALNLVVAGSSPTVNLFKYVADWSAQWSWGKASRLRLAAHSSGLSDAGISIRIDKISAVTRNQNP